MTSAITICEIRAYKYRNMIEFTTMAYGSGSTTSTSASILKGTVSSLIRLGPIGYSKSNADTSFSTFSMQAQDPYIDFDFATGKVATIFYIVLIGNEDSSSALES